MCVAGLERAEPQAVVEAGAAVAAALERRARLAADWPGFWKRLS